MRLKYLKTKMKILCFFLLWILAVSVFGQSVELHGIVGESIEFPAAVKIDGILTYSGITIGDVTNDRFTAPHSEKFNGRVQRDSSTGLFSLSGLKMEDSGEYTVHNTQQNINTVFQLNVYIPVSKPNVIIHYASCTIECTAESGTGVTLSWHREGEKKPYVSSRVASAPHLHLPQTVERSGTYTCEAKNSVSNEKASITVEAHCTAGPSAGTIVAIIITVVAVPIAVVFAVLYRRTKTERRDKQALLQDDVRRLILDEDNQGLIKDDVRRIRLVKQLLDNIVAPASDDDRQAFIHDAVRRLILVQEISEEMVTPAHEEEMQALRSNVKKLLDILVAPASDVRKIRLEEMQALRSNVKDILDKVDSRAYRKMN